MSYANTTTAREILRKAFVEANMTFGKTTYTEKTTDFDPDRRSVCFTIDDGDATLVVKIAKRMFKDAGFTKSVPYATSAPHTGYVRVIAYMH